MDGVLIDARDDSPPGSLVLEIWDDGYKKVEVLMPLKMVILHF